MQELEALTSPPEWEEIIIVIVLLSVVPNEPSGLSIRIKVAFAVAEIKRATCEENSVYFVEKSVQLCFGLQMVEWNHSGSKAFEFSHVEI